MQLETLICPEEGWKAGAEVSGGVRHSGRCSRLENKDEEQDISSHWSQPK